MDPGAVVAMVCAILGGCGAMAMSLISVGRKVERVDSRLGFIERQLEQWNKENLVARVIALEREVEYLRRELDIERQRE